MVFDIPGQQVQQLIDADRRTPQHAHQQVVAFAAAARSIKELEYLILHVVGDLLLRFSPPKILFGINPSDLGLRFRSIE
ncbi:MAG: hypothetical protein WAL97_10325 [Halobacteriota archaeon]